MLTGTLYIYIYMGDQTKVNRIMIDRCQRRNPYFASVIHDNKKGGLPMKRKGLITISTFLICAFVVGVFSAWAEKPIKWKAQSLFSTGELTYKTFEDFCLRVKVLTNGRLEITPYPAGAIVPTFEMLDAVKNNIIQAMHTGAAYFMGKDTALGIISDLIYSYEEAWEFEAWFYHRGGLDLLNELYRPFRVTAIGVVMWGRESFPSKFPIRRMEDYKGHKFRSPQGMTADMLQKLGAAVVILPGGEVFSALDKGVIEGTDWGSPSMNHRLGFDQVAKYFIYPEYRSMPASDFTVNTKQWKKLPPDIQEILKAAIREWNWDCIARTAMDDMQAIEEMVAGGATPVAWEKEEVNRLREFVRTTVWEEWAQKSPMCRKIIDSHLEWLRELGRIK
jgi:TRAP-type mannitol/chloroaromatic compound transport system substrate-binding protein